MENLMHINFIKKFIDSFLGKGSFILFNLLFSFIVTKLYGPEIFGEFTYLYTIISFIMILAIAGLDSGLMYFIPKYKYKYVSLCLTANLVFSTVISGVVFFLMDDNYAKLFIPLIWLLSMEQIFFAIYRVEEKIKEFYIINSLLFNIIRISLIVSLFYLFGEEKINLLISLYLALVIANLLYYKSNKNKIKKIKYNKAIFIYSFPLILSAVSGVILEKIDIVMIGNMLTKEEVAIYQINTQVAYISASLLIIFNTIFPPKISTLYHNNRIDELKSLYISTTRILAILSLIIVILVILFGEFILGYFGDVYEKGKYVLYFRSIGQFINASVGSVWFMLAMTGNPKIQMYGNLSICIVNIVLNFILIPVYGIEGAAVASMISVILLNLIGYMIVSKKFNIKVYKYI